MIIYRRKYVSVVPARLLVGFCIVCYLGCYNLLKADVDKDQVASMFVAGQYHELDGLAESLRRSLPTVHDYDDDLSGFYAAFPEPSRNSSDEEWGSYKAKLDEWQKSEPGSVTVMVVMANYYIDFGWRARGGGWAQEVTEKGWQALKDDLQKAGKLLDDATGLTQHDSQIYRSLLSVALGGERSRDQMEEAFKRGLEARPFCYDLYRSKAQYLLQRWYGKRGDVERFAEVAANKFEGEDADAMYAVIGQQVALTEGSNFLSVTNFSWDRLSRGLLAIIKNSEKSQTRTHELNVFLYLACVNKKWDTAGSLVANFPSGSWETRFWGDGLSLDQLRQLVGQSKNGK